MQYRLNQAGQLIVREDGERSDRLEWDENECLSGFYRTGERGERYQYHYDALRRRIRKTCINMSDRVEKITYFIWDGDALTAEVSFSPIATGANAKLDSRFFVYYLNTFEPLVLQCKQQGIGSLAPPEETGYYFYQNDPNGMPLRLYDVQGEIAWSAHYSAFGRVDRLDEIKVKQPLRLQGQYFDEESGLHYNRHRYYDPRTGIFVCQDPIGLVGGSNPYQYAPNTLMWVDPLGLDSGFIYRGDDGYSGGAVGLPKEGSVTASDIVNHVQNQKGDKLTSFSENMKNTKNANGAEKFGSTILKVSKEDLATLEKNGDISIITPDQARDIIKADSKKKISKEANNVKRQMEENGEVLVHGQVPEDNISSCKISNKGNKR